MSQTTTSEAGTSITSDGSDAAAVGAARSTPLMWAILAVVILADALDVIDASVTNLAAPTIARDLGGGQALIKWLGTAYLLSMGVLLVVGGRLGDRFGQRRLFLIGMTGFVIASAVAGLSPDPVLLIVARAAQGAFGALLLPQGMAIMTKAFTPAMLARAFGLFGPTLGATAIAGPVLAGFLIGADLLGLSWRPIFLINVILGAAGLLLAVRILPRDDGDRTAAIDVRGAVLLAATMLGLLYGLIEGSSDGWTAEPIASVAAGVACFLAFAHRQATAARPLIKPTLLQNRGFTSGLLAGLVLFAATTGLFYVLSLFIQDGLHAGPGAASLTLMPLMLGVIGAAFAAMGGLVAKLGRTLIFIGLGVVLIAGAWILALVATSGTTLSLWALAAPLFLTGLGVGCFTSTVYTVALGDTDPDEAGSASGSLSAIQQLASAIGSAGVTTIFFAASGPGLDHAFLVTLIVVLGGATLSLPLVARMPRATAPDPSA